MDCVYLISSGLGDTFCATGALNQYYQQTNKKLYVISNKPTLFSGQEYCEASIDIKALNGDGDIHDSNRFKNFDKIHTLYWQSEKHLKGELNIAETHCDLLKVSLVKKPYYEFFINELNDFYITSKPYILVSFCNKNSSDVIHSDNKYLTLSQSSILIKKLKRDFPKYEIIDLASVKASDYKHLIFAAAKCKTFVSVDTALQHLCANHFYQTKGIVLWNNKKNVNLYGYKENINLVNDFVHPFNNYDIIKQSINEILHT